jgi:formate C-acetyltransferase
MEFWAVGKRKRPVRLCESTRRFAWDSLNRKYGADTARVSAIAIDDLPDLAELSPLEKYDAAILRIATEAPLRICEGERLSGAATLGMAMDHRVPATCGGKKLWVGISHLTVDFESVLREGLDGIRTRVQNALKTQKVPKRVAFLQSCLHCLDAFSLWHGRYLAALRDMPAYRANYENLLTVPHRPAETFYQAVQSVWMTFAFLRLCGNWPGVGRIDVMLEPYLQRDLQAGRLTLSEAREILAHFFIKGCEWINGEIPFLGGSGDAQHYQNLVIGGVDENGKEATGDVTYLVLDVLEELPIGDYPTTVRLNSRTDEKLVRRVAEVMRYGGGVLAVYNEDMVLKALEKDGYDLREARQFANDGCWEVQIPGKTFFAYTPIDSLQILQQKALNGYENCENYESFEALYAAYLEGLTEAAEGVLTTVSRRMAGRDEESGEWLWIDRTPCTVISLLEGGCIEKGLSYLEGGPVYNVQSPHLGGLADTANSLLAIQKLVYEEKKLSLAALLDILKRNWEGAEELRGYVRTAYAYYGNDSDGADLLAARIMGDFAKICKKLNGRCGYRFPSGVSTFGRQLEWAPKRLATPYGRLAGEVLAGNCSPTPGTDAQGATAVIRSYCKIDHAALATGAALDVRLLPTSVEGEIGLQALMGLMRGFVSLGGFFMQLDVADAALLREAQANPEDYKTLAVRVSGWNARFITLDREWQEMVIAQNGG